MDFNLEIRLHRKFTWLEGRPDGCRNEKQKEDPIRDTQSLGRPFISGTENYLLCLYKMNEDSEFPTITQLTDYLRQLPATESLGTSVPSVAGMIRRMRKQGLVNLDTGKRILLTKQGLAIGEDMARRHRLAEWLVVRLIGCLRTISIFCVSCLSRSSSQTKK